MRHKAERLARSKRRAGKTLMNGNGDRRMRNATNGWNGETAGSGETRRRGGR